MRRLAASLLLAGLAVSLSACAPKSAVATQNADGSQSAKIMVRQGYHPATIEAKADKPLKLEFYRDEDAGGHSCDEVLVVPSENVRLDLPSRESQIVEIKGQSAGREVAFQCGMDMMKGKIVFR